MSRVLCLKVLVSISIGIQLLITVLIFQFNSTRVVNFLRLSDPGGSLRPDRISLDSTTGHMDRWHLHKTHMFVATGTHWRSLSETRQVGSYRATFNIL